jgi:hypothetical protein
VIDQVFAAFQPFERYGFNKAHATCYGLIAYQTAYLKANYTVEYMTSVLTAFRDNAEKVAAAVAECRRMGIEVRPPDVHRSGIEFTVEGEAIRFGLLAVKNVGQGAIESIIAARESGGDFNSLRDFCERVDLRLVNSRVIEALAWVGALSAFGHPVQIIDALPTILPSAQAVQQQRASGQISAFDLMFTEATDERLPTRPEASRRERLRREKELLGIYLSEHPMGEVADRVGEFVTAYSGDLRDESLDGQRVVVGGIVTGLRTVITKAKAAMAVVTLEDLQGTIEVVVFPRLWEQSSGTWAEGAVLLVAGRIDHRGEEVSLLADLALEWDDAVARGPEAFGREVAAGERGSVRRRQPDGGPRPGGPAPGGAPATNGHRPPADRVPVAVGPGRPVEAPTANVPFVSPLRADAPVEAIPAAAPLAARAPATDLPSIAPAEPIPTYVDPSAGVGPDDDHDEPALPDEVRSQAADAAARPTLPIEAGPNQVLHVRFGGASAERILEAMRSFRELIRNRPGETRVLVHVDVAGQEALPMELRPVAYDAELLADVRRRFGEGVVDLSLG